jgi:chemotaxis protein MotA
MDYLSIVGLLLAIAAIFGGNAMEGGSVEALLNGPAAMIVIGGTTAAVFIQTPYGNLKHSFQLLKWVFASPYISLDDGVEKLISWSMRARKEGLLGLESLLVKEQEDFCKKGLQLLVDGSEPEVIKSVLEVDMYAREQNDLDAAKVFESMAGYSPTIGIIGAVMGLIHVMSNLADPASLGAGIATAFVATIYGVAFANLCLLPIANKLKHVVRRKLRYHEMIVDGLISIAEGENPRALELKLRGYLHLEPAS